MKIKKVFTYSPTEKKVRLFRLLWGSFPSDAGYLRILTISLRPRLYWFAREYTGWLLTVLGIHLHFQRASRGIFV